MNRGLALCIGLTTLLAGSVAFAQEEVRIGYQGLPYKAGGESNTGVQLSEGVLLHAGVGAEFGYDTNVFYDYKNEVGSSLIRVMPFADLTNATRNGPVSSLVTFDARAALQYRHYGNSTVSSQYRDAWNPNAGLSVNLGGAQFAFGVADLFARIEDPPYASGGNLTTGPIQRTNNQASIEGRWSPGGGRLTTTLRYTNMVDVFEGSYAYADADTNTLMLDASWKWLPKTGIFLNIQQSYVDYFHAGNNPKTASYPLIVTTGLRGLLTDKTSAVLALGYLNGFYSSGGSTGGFLGSTYLNFALTSRLTPFSRAVLGFRHDFINAIISNFAYEDSVYASFVQQILTRLALDISGRYARYSYQGTFVDTNQSGRVDNMFQVGGTLDYFLRNWAYVGVGYSLLVNRSNIHNTTGDAIDNYVKQQVFARLGVTY